MVSDRLFCAVCNVWYVNPVVIVFELFNVGAGVGDSANAGEANKSNPKMIFFMSGEVLRSGPASDPGESSQAAPECGVVQAGLLP
jgi:hypothetical protein